MDLKQRVVVVAEQKPGARKGVFRFAVQVDGETVYVTTAAAQWERTYANGYAQGVRCALARATTISEEKS
jgi:hypothetical protein